MGHWTWKMRRQRWPWLEVCLADYFMSVFRCVCSWARRRLRESVAEEGQINVTRRTQSITFIVCVKPISVVCVQYNQEKHSWLFSHDVCVCVCVRARSWPQLRHQRQRGVISDMCQGPKSRVIIYKHTQRNRVWGIIGPRGTTWLTLSPITRCAHAPLRRCLFFVIRTKTFLSFPALRLWEKIIKIIQSQNNINRTRQK